MRRLRFNPPSAIYELESGERARVVISLQNLGAKDTISHYSVHKIDTSVTRLLELEQMSIFRQDMV